MWSALPAVSLDELIVPGPVERGLYIAPETGDVASRIAKKLVGMLDEEHAPAGNAAAAPNLPKLRYSPMRYWRRNSRIGQLIWIDSASSFDPYAVIAESKKRKLDPVRMLRAIKVHRPFNASEFQQMLERVPNPALWAPDKGFPTLPERVRDEGLKNSQAVWWTPLVVISDLMRPFYDPNLSDEALIRSFRSFMIQLSFLRQRAIVLALLKEEMPPANRHHLLPDILKMARQVADPFAVQEACSAA